jgi:flavin reductase (DIM6/NTAB) family NADH-FMN oxidoreductase RutF
MVELTQLTPISTKRAFNLWRTNQMKKVLLNPQPLLCAVPTVLVGTVVNGKPTFMTVAWVGVANSNPPMVSVAIRPARYTLKGMINKEFSVNVPSADIVKEADYCGIVSGAEVDKVAVCKFNIFYGVLKHAPLIEQCPVNLVCKVEHILELGTHHLIIGRVEETHISDNCLTEGKPDFKKIKPFLYGMASPSEYYALGDSLGRGFSIGKELTAKK